MRIRSLTLERYGAFENRRVEFGPRLTLVIGANEAGKSTTLEALSDLLWGFQRGRQTFAFGPGTLSLAACVTLSTRARLAAAPAALSAGAGNEAGAGSAAEVKIELRRRKTGLQTADTDAPFEPVWGGPDGRERWRGAFGLSHAELRAGGERLFRGDGDLAELVFTARSGRTVHNLVADLAGEADRLYKEHRNNKTSALRRALAEYNQLSAQAREKMTRAGDVDRARGDRDRRQREAQRAAERLAEANRVRERLEQRSRAAPHVRELVRLRAERAPLLAAGPVLDAGQIERYTALRDSLDQLTEMLTQKRGELAAKQRERAALTVDATILADADAITRLERAAEARAADAGAADELAAEARRLLAEARAELGPLVGPAEDRPADELLAELHVPADLAAQLDELAAEVDELAAELKRAEQAVGAAEDRLRASQQDLPVFEPGAVALVSQVVRAIRKEDSAWMLTRDAVRGAEEAVRARRAAMLRAGARDVDAVPPVPPPLQELRAARARVEQAEKDLERRETVLADADGALEQVQRQLAEADGADLPDHGTLDQARAERAELWGALVRALTGSAAEPSAHLPTGQPAGERAAAGQAAGGQASGEEIAALLHRLAAGIQRVDEVADQLISHADQAAERARLRQEVERARARHQEALDARAIMAQKLADVRRDWERLWEQLGLAVPELPDAEEVRRALVEAQEAQTTLLALEQRISHLAGQVEAQRATLAEALAQAGRPCPDGDMESLLAAAEALAADDDVAENARREAQIYAREVQKAERSRDELAGRLRAAELAWEELLSRAGLAAVLGPRGWRERRERLDRARAAYEQARQAEREAAASRRRHADFVAEVLGLAARHGLTAAPPAPAGAAPAAGAATVPGTAEDAGPALGGSAAGSTPVDGAAADSAAAAGAAVGSAAVGSLLDQLVRRLEDSQRAREVAGMLDRGIADLSRQIDEAGRLRRDALAGLAELREEIGLPPIPSDVPGGGRPEPGSPDDGPVPADQPPDLDEELLDGGSAERCPGGRALAEAVERSRRVLDLARREEDEENFIRAKAPAEDLERLVEELAGRTDDDLAAELAGAVDQVRRCDSEHNAARTALGEIEGQLRQMEAGESAGELHAQAQERLALVAECAERHLIARIQHHILSRELAAYERRHASSLLGDAGRILEQLTEGRYVALRATDRGTERELTVIQADGEPRAPEELSEGTADQVYLALRLAAIDQLQAERVARGELTLPVVLDDVLMTFDDTRAAAALRVLADLSRRWQIIVLTHHEHLADIARRVGADAPGAEAITISRLPGANAIARQRDPEEIRQLTAVQEAFDFDALLRSETASTVGAAVGAATGAATGSPAGGARRRGGRSATAVADPVGDDPPAGRRQARTRGKTR